MCPATLATLAAVLLLGATAAHRPHGCHNATGTCLAHGFVCASGQTVPHHQRCNGVEECGDGTDEYLCHDSDRRPVFQRGRLPRRALAQGEYSCARCTCLVNTQTFTNTNPWWPFVITARMSPDGLLTGGSSLHAGQPCSNVNTVSLSAQLFRKDFTCRGPLCCIRQLQCLSCSGGFNPIRRCIEV